MSLSDFVNLSITRSSVSVTQQGFGTLMVVGENERTGLRTAAYSSAAEMLTAGYLETDEEYLLAVSAFAQNPSVTSIKVGEKVAGDASWTAAIAAIKADDNDWYGLAISSHASADQLEVAGVVEADNGGNGKFFWISSDEAAIVDQTFAADTTSIVALIRAQAYVKTAVIYSGVADTVYPEGGMATIANAEVPGSYTLAHKTIIGTTADNLTTTQATNATDKNANIYTTTAGRSVIQWGRITEGGQALGEYIDTIIGIDWTFARVSEEIFRLFVSSKKVPFTNAGITGVQAQIEGVLQTGIDNGLFSPMEFDENDVQVGGFRVNVPIASDVSTADKLARNLTGVTFTAWLGGAIHVTTINGVVSV